MIALLADENFNGRILNGMIRENLALDVLRVQDIPELYMQPDPEVLAWAAQQNRILLSHDADTMPTYAYDRIAAGLPMPGVFLVHADMPIGQAIEQLLTAIGASIPNEWENRVEFFPL